MKRLTTFGVVMMLAAGTGIASAQMSKTLPTEKMETVTVTVEAIEKATREVTVKKPDGTYDSFYVPLEIKRFDTLKIGDKITAKYYETVVAQLQPAGSAPVNSNTNSETRSAGGNAATAAHQRTMTVTVTKIDPKVPSITVTGPNNWVYSRRVSDTKALAKVKVGDKIDITWTEALLVSVEDGK